MRYLVLISCLLVATSCSHNTWEGVLANPADTTARRELASQLHTGRVKFNGPVTLQIGGTGNTGTATDATKAKAPVAAAPHATATETTTKTGGTPWYVFAVLTVVGFAGGFVVRGKLKIPLPF